MNMATARIFLAAFIVLSTLSPSFAQTTSCISGLPCDVDLTPNDPKKDKDGPNAPGSPNEPKRGSSDACDSDFMNQIYAKAYMEAERQNVVGAFLIRKPDSVLEYTCFNKMASRAATIAAPIFTETQDWINKEVLIWGEINKTDIDTAKRLTGKVEDLIPTVAAGKAAIPPWQYQVIMNVFMGTDRVDKSIQEVVLKSVGTYLTQNFSHTFIGGTTTMDYPNGGVFEPSIDYDCDMMEKVHHYAKCVNFNSDDHYKDKFFSFQDLASYDPRLLPDPCGGPPPIGPPNIVDGNKTINISKNTGFKYAAFDKDDKIYDDLINGACKPGIKTGITLSYIDKSVETTIVGDVNFGEPEQYNDLVCPNLGCSIEKDSWQCK